jgi:hypothetical protein
MSGTHGLCYYDHIAEISIAEYSFCMKLSMPSILQKQLMLVIKNLCKGHSNYPKTELATAIARLEQAKLPPFIRTGDAGKLWI